MRARHLAALVVLSLTLGQVQPAAAVIGPVADVAVSAGAWPQAVVPGGVIDFTLMLNNVGPFDASNVVLRIAVPANTTFVSWSNISRDRTDVPAFTPPPGGTGTVSACIGTLGKPASPGDYRALLFVLRVRVDPNAMQGLTITGTANVPGVRTADALWCPATTYDPAPENNAATTTASVSGPADLAVTASASPDPVTAGSDLTYTLDVTNLGPYDAESVVLSDWFAPDPLVSFSQESGPAFTLKTTDTGGEHKVTASIAVLAAGATARFTLVINVPPTVPSYATIDDDAAVTSATGDPDYHNDSITVRTPLAAGP